MFLVVLCRFLPNTEMMLSLFLDNRAFYREYMAYSYIPKAYILKEINLRRIIQKVLIYLNRIFIIITIRNTYDNISRFTTKNLFSSVSADIKHSICNNISRRTLTSS
jgi:hypothetical protein